MNGSRHSPRSPGNDDESGQALLIGVMILLLLLTAIPAIIFLNQHATSHGVESQRRLKARTVAEEGVAYAIQQLSQLPAGSNWPYLGGTLPSSGTFTSMQQSSFTITYASASVSSPSLQNYQVQIIARPTMWNPASQQIVPVPGSSIATIVSQRTVGVRLPTGLSASAALDMLQAPTFPPLYPNGAQLDVELGPIVCRNNDAANPPGWRLDSITKNYKRPRKFSSGEIDPRCTSSTSTITDQKEYWAYTHPGFSPVINLTSYQNAALAETCNTLPGCTPSCTVTPVVVNPPSGSPYPSCVFTVPLGDTAVFDNTYPIPAPNSVIYVEGNAKLQLQGITWNLSNNGAFIVDGTNPTYGGGTLTLGDGDASAIGFSPVIPMPPTALEDPYLTCGGVPPCNGHTTRNLDFLGFLYTNGSLNIAPSGGNPYWTLDGVVRVDGPMTVGPNANVLIYYNDVVNHSIQTSNFELQIDSTTAIP